MSSLSKKKKTKKKEQQISDQVKEVENRKKILTDSILGLKRILTAQLQQFICQQAKYSMLVHKTNQAIGKRVLHFINSSSSAFQADIESTQQDTSGSTASWITYLVLSNQDAVCWLLLLQGGLEVQCDILFIESVEILIQNSKVMLVSISLNTLMGWLHQLLSKCLCKPKLFQHHIWFKILKKYILHTLILPIS